MVLLTVDTKVSDNVTPLRHTCTLISKQAHSENSRRITTHSFDILFRNCVTTRRKLFKNLVGLKYQKSYTGICSRYYNHYITLEITFSNYHFTTEYGYNSEQLGTITVWSSSQPQDSQTESKSLSRTLTIHKGTIRYRIQNKILLQDPDLNDNL